MMGTLDMLERRNRTQDTTAEEQGRNHHWGCALGWFIAGLLLLLLLLLVGP